MKKLLGTFGLLCLAISADAATLYYSYPGSPYVTAIGSLDIGGTLYNVDFDADAYGTFGGDDEFWTTEAEASAAVDAINAFFLVNSVYGVANDGISSCEGAPCYTVKFGPSDSVGALNFGGWENYGSIGYGSELAPLATAWSVAVPIPASIWLFGSALAGLGWMRRKQTVQFG
jgi:hypothetical protein